MTRFLIAFGLLFSHQSFAQYLIKGIVYDNEGNPMPGVNVIEYKSDGTTVTDQNGNFVLNCFKPQQTIVFSFIGFLPQEVIADTAQIVKVTLQPDPQIIARGEPWVCVFYDRHTKIGLSTGLKYTTLGLKVESFIPEIFGIWTLVTPGFEWRTSNLGNQYVDIYLRRYEILRLSPADISLFGEFKEINTTQTNVKEFNISPDLTFRRFRISLGYTYQMVTNSEVEKDGSGFCMAAYAYFFKHLGADLKTKFVLDKFQYDFKLYWNFDNPRITAGIGYEKVHLLDEVTATVQYRLSY